MLAAACRAVDGRGPYVGQSRERVAIRIDADRNQLVGRRTANHDRAHRSLPLYAARIGARSSLPVAYASVRIPRPRLSFKLGQMMFTHSEGCRGNSAELAHAFESHLEETKEQIFRLEKVFETLGKKAAGEKCPAIDGILTEGEEMMKEIKDPDTRDAAMIAAAQAVEHYEITRYGTLVSWGELLGNKDAVKLLSATLKEEHAADSKLNKLAEGKLNKQAA